MGRQGAKFEILVVLVIGVLTTIVACSRGSAPAKLSPDKKKAGVTKGKGLRKSYVTPAKFHILLSALDEADSAFQGFLALENPDMKNVISPFRAVASFLRTHQKEDRLKVELKRCPKFKSRLRITQDNDKEDKPISAVVLDATENCEGADFQNIARFNYENLEIRATLRTMWFADGFGRTLAQLDREATCVIQLDSEQKLSVLRCQGLGQDRPSGGHLELPNFEFTASSGKVNARWRLCAGTDSTCSERENSSEVFLPK